MTCIITGCKVYDPLHYRYAHGDLHRIGETYVFHACINTNQQTNWHDGLPEESEKILIYQDFSGDSVDVRGVLVIPPNIAQLNQVAIDYIKNYGGKP